MKLLSKQQVSTQLQSQRRQQIDEGVQLAQKIDALRVKLADLQKQHELFVMGMEENLNQKTKHLFDEIQRREAEIKLLEVKRLELLKPLDAEWEIVRTTKVSLDNKTYELEGVLKELEGKEQRVTKRDLESKEKLNHIKIRERELERTFDKAEQLKIDAERGYIKMVQDKEIQDDLYLKKQQELLLQEKAIKSYQFTLKNKEEILEMKDKELEEERIRLKDREETLNRAFNRIKNKI